MSRKTRSWRIASPSIRQRNQLLAQTDRALQFYTIRAQALTHALMIIIKRDGSEMKPGEFRLSVEDNPKFYPKEHEVLETQTGPNGEMLLTVKDGRLNDPGLAAQVEAYKKELQETIYETESQ
jgi:hypothetical protein